MNLLSDGNIISSIGPIFQGLGELLLALGAGLGFLLRSRRNARSERLRAETAATLAAQETKTTLEAKLEAQHATQISQFEAQIKQLQLQLAEERKQGDGQLIAERAAHAEVLKSIQEQYNGVQKQNERLMESLLKSRNSNRQEDQS